MKEIATISIGIGNIKQRAFYHRRPEGNLLDRRIAQGCGPLDLRCGEDGEEVIPGLLDSIRKATSERREYGKGKKATGATAKGRK